jgi:PAS domain S-box-containing protein
MLPPDISQAPADGETAERLRQAELLQAAEQRYRNLLAHAPIVVFAVDAAGQFTVSEGRGLEAIGLKPDELVGKSAFDLYGDMEVLERSGQKTNGADVIHRVLAGETVQAVNEVNGRIFENSLLPMRNASGAVDGMMGVSHDITELHRAGDALRTNEERFRRVVENISDVITVLDPQGTILYESPSISRVLGYQQAELLGRNAFELVHPDDVEQVLRAFEANTPEIIVRRFRFRHRDGSWRTLEAAGKVHQAEDGSRAAIIASRDLTERERGNAESRLLQEVTWRVAQAPDTETALASVMRLASEAFGWVYAEAWVLSGDGAWLEPSVVWHSAEARFDVYREEPERSRMAPGTGLPGTVWTQKRAVWIADVAEVGEFVRRDAAREAGLHAALAVPITRDDNETIAAVLILYAAQPQEEDARLTALFSAVAAQLGAAMQRKDAEMALRSSQALLHSVVTSAPIVLFALDQNGVFTLSEGKGLEGLGLAPGELVGASAVEAFRDQTAFGEHLRRALAGEAFVASSEVAGRSFDTWYSPRIGADGTVSGVLGVATDLTERRQLEEQLRQAQKLESLGLLAGGIAHDFNNIITAITGYADLIADQLPPGDSVRDEVAEITRAAEKAALLTYQLLAFSRKQLLRPETLSLNTIVADVSRMLRRVIGEDISLVVRGVEELGQASADPGQIGQVILNLAVNARDAMPNGGTLTIETANVELDDDNAATDGSMPRGPHVMLAVRDTGTGMSTDVRARIFEPFFTTKGIGKGTGMGLATVYGIVSQSGGHVSVESEPGQGTTFKVYLPRVAEAARSAAAPARDLPFARGTETVLLVEDEEVVRRLARRALETCGYTVLEAGNGEEAVALSASRAAHIDILITDVVMPKMSGRELVEHLSVTRPGLKILYMSGYTDDAVVHRGVLNEATHFLQKPFTMRALARKIRDVLDGPPLP